MPTRNGNTSLHSAIKNFESDISPIKILLEQDDSDINVINLEGETPLHMSVKHKNRSAKLTKLLLVHGADVKATTPRDGNTALHWAVIRNPRYDIHYAQITRALLEYGSDVNARNLEGYIPLHLAVMKRELLHADIQILLEHESDADAGDCKQNNTPLHLLMQNKIYSFRSELITKFLKKMQDVNVVNAKGETPLHVAVRNKNCRYIVAIELLKLEEKQIERGIHIEATHQRTYQNGYRKWAIQRVLDSSLLSRCSEELKKMSETKVGKSSITFLDLLLLSPKEMAIYVKNKEVVEAFRILPENFVLL